MAVLAMFPLGSVLLPGELLPLQVFEPRYRQLVIDLLADDVDEPEFGVTLIERGHEVGGGDHRAGIGTVARIIRIDALDEARYAVVAVGVRRIRVNAWLPDDPYPLADIDDWPDPAEEHDGDDAAGLAAQIAAARARVESTRRLAAEVADESSDEPIPEFGDDLVNATYHLVSLSPLGAADRYRLLAAESPARRLALLHDALDDVDAVLEFQRR